MGFLNFLLKNGPGSPGSTAKTYAEFYNSLLKANPNASVKELFSMLYQSRKLTAEKIDNTEALFNDIKFESIFSSCKEDFVKFIFIMMYLETNNFRYGIRNGGFKMLSETVKVIYDNSKKYSLHLHYDELNDTTISIAKYIDLYDSIFIQTEKMNKIIRGYI